MTEDFSTPYHTVIIGAGASGLMCAGSFNARKLLIDHNPRPGAKLAVSGGGKCNFSNLNITAAHYTSQNKHFCKNALAAYKNTDFLKLLDENCVPWQQLPSGQLFAQNAQDIVRLLVRRAQQANTYFKLNTQALGIKKDGQGLFIVQTSRGNIKAQNLVLACGGLSFPSLGAGPFGVQAARAMGLNIIEPSPALAGFTFPRALKQHTAPLAGNSLPVQIRCGKFTYMGPLLFTHEGISGPAVLQTSLFWHEGEQVTVNFLPGTDALAFLREHKNTAKHFSALLAEKISPKIAKALLAEADVPAANATTAHLHLAAQRLNAFVFVPEGTAGWTKAEVTRGGVDTKEINPSTMQCRRIPGLFITGELLDVTGMLGGYNLQWAWSSGRAAAKALEQIF